MLFLQIYLEIFVSYFLFYRNQKDHHMMRRNFFSHGMQLHGSSLSLRRTLLSFPRVLQLERSSIPIGGFTKLTCALRYQTPGDGKGGDSNSHSISNKPADPQPTKVAPSQNPAEINKKSQNDNPASATLPPRFERFYHPKLLQVQGKEEPRKFTKAALSPVSQDERDFLQRKTDTAQAQRRLVKFAIVGFIGIPYLFSKLWGGSKQLGSSAQLTASACEGDASALSITMNDGSGRKTSIGFVTADVDKHVARFYDSDRNLIAQETFVDFTTFEQKVESSGIASHRNNANTSGDGSGNISHLFPPPLYVNVPHYFPYAAIAFLWMLPIMAIVNRNMFGGIRQLRSEAQKQAGAAATQFRFKTEHDVKVKLADVAGLTEPKVEIKEIIDFMRNPKRYTDLGAKLPKGILLDGPPGTGKTMLAKAVAGEATVPMVSCSGSEFEEIYVGTGALRVRELFKAARKAAPAVIFIDEIDTFGRKRRNDRGKNSRGTINALLSELDGFTEADNIIVLAATNRADILDEALTRSGRFDRKITVDLPPHKDRVQIAKVHLAPLKLDGALKIDDVAENIASMTAGHSGADIKNICNEAAIYASRMDLPHVNHDCFSYSMDRIMIGMEKKAKKLTPEKRERRAYHEAGHVILSWFQQTTDPVLKATISTRGGRTEGFTQKLPAERFISTQAELRENMVQLLGGYVAEEYFFHCLSTNAADDLRRVTEAAKREVIVYGMHPEVVGHVHYSNMDQLEKPYGPLQQEAIDAQTKKIVEESLTKARSLLREKLQDVRIVAGLLMKNESLTGKDLWLVLGDRPNMTDVFRNYLIGANSDSGRSNNDTEKQKDEVSSKGNECQPTADAAQ